jgi:hypothetical protein
MSSDRGHIPWDYPFRNIAIDRLSAGDRLSRYRLVVAEKNVGLTVPENRIIRHCSIKFSSSILLGGEEIEGIIHISIGA